MIKNIIAFLALFAVASAACTTYNSSATLNQTIPMSLTTNCIYFNDTGTTLYIPLINTTTNYTTNTTFTTVDNRTLNFSIAATPLQCNINKTLAYSENYYNAACGINATAPAFPYINSLVNITPATFYTPTPYNAYNYNLTAYCNACPAETCEECETCEYTCPTLTCEEPEYDTTEIGKTLEYQERYIVEEEGCYKRKIDLTAPNAPTYNEETCAVYVEEAVRNAMMNTSAFDCAGNEIIVDGTRYYSCNMSSCQDSVIAELRSNWESLNTTVTQLRSENNELSGYKVGAEAGGKQIETYGVVLLIGAITCLLIYIYFKYFKPQNKAPQTPTRPSIPVNRGFPLGGGVRR